MTKHWDDVVMEVGTLADHEQDRLADLVAVSLPQGDQQLTISEAQVAEVQQILDEIASGKSRLVSETDMEDFWKECGWHQVCAAEGFA